MQGSRMGPGHNSLPTSWGRQYRGKQTQFALFFSGFRDLGTKKTLCNENLGKEIRCKQHQKPAQVKRNTETFPLVSTL